MGDQYRYDDTGVNVTAGAASASVAIPASSEILYVATTQNARFRITKGASTALATDPMVQASCPLFVRCPPNADTLSVIQDTATGTVSATRVFED